MTTRYFAIPKHDGGVVILETYDATPPQAYCARWHPNLQSEIDIAGIREITLDEVPTDRTFRDAWKLDLTHDMAKARDIQREHLRRLCAPKLAALDVEYQRADEAGDVALKRQIAAQRQALRDVTGDPAIEAAQAPDELKAVIPAVLLD
jgi:hypothetical protein